MKWRIGFTIEMRIVPSNMSGQSYIVSFSVYFAHVERNHSFLPRRSCCRCCQVLLTNRKGKVKAFPRTKEIAPIPFTIWCSKYQQGIFVLKRNTWDLIILNWENPLKVTWAGINTTRSKHTFYHPFSIYSTTYPTLYRFLLKINLHFVLE